jgi:hypothetical protein
MPWGLTVVLDQGNAMVTYGRIGPGQCYGNLQSYWTIKYLLEHGLNVIGGNLEGNVVHK